MKEFHDFIQYCLNNPKDSLPRLHEKYSSSHKETFSLLEFMKWKNKVDQLTLLEDFNNFPFLRDEAFLFYIKESSYSLKGNCCFSVCEFIKQSQFDYYTTFINSRLTLNPETTTTPTNVSKCPFSPAKSKSPNNIFVLDHSIIKAKYSAFASSDIHISSFEHIKSQCKTLTRIINDSTKNYQNDHEAKYLVLTGGIHEDLKHSPDTVIIMTTQTSLKIITSPVYSPILPSNTLETLLSVRNLFSAIDSQLLFSNIIAIHPDDLSLILNLIVYAEVLNVELKSIAKETCKAILQPSPLEPYLDLLTSDFITSNADLFA